MISKFIIKDIFEITCRGLALAGYIKQGEINIGDLIEFNALDKSCKLKITGISGIRKSIYDETNTGLLVKCEDENVIDEIKIWKPDCEVGIILKE